MTVNVEGLSLQAQIVWGLGPNGYITPFAGEFAITQIPNTSAPSGALYSYGNAFAGGYGGQYAWGQTVVIEEWAVGVLPEGGTFSVVESGPTQYAAPAPSSATDSLSFGYLGPTGPAGAPAPGYLGPPQGADAYTFPLGAHTFLMTTAGFFNEPADSGITFVLSGTYTSSQSARLEGQMITLMGSGTFTTPLLNVAGNVTVNGGTLHGDVVIIDNDTAYLGSGVAPTTTTLTITGGSAVFQAPTYLAIGTSTNGPASLIMMAGATGNVGPVYLGLGGPGSVGNITINGATLTSTSFIDIGESTLSTGKVSILGGGQLTTQNAAVGYGKDALGAVTMTGAGSIWTVNGFIAIGYNDPEITSTLSVQNGAMVTIQNYLVLGGDVDPTNGNLTGNGSLSITGGGIVITGTSLSSTTTLGAAVGFGPSSNGTVLIDGASSLWDIKARLDVGYSAGSTGSVTVQNGGTLQVESDIIRLGSAQGSTGTLTFDKNGGANPTMTFNGGTNSQLLIGDDGVGHFFVQGGAQITTGATVIIGNENTGVGDATVQGTNSSWTITGNLTVGENGTGTLTIKNGDSVTVNGTATLGDQNGSNGTLTLDGAGSKLTLTTSGNTLTIGNDGIGTLTIQNGASVTLPATDLGLQTDGSGVINVIGTGTGGTAASTVTISGQLVVGVASGMSQQVFNGLYISGGGKVTSGAATIGLIANSYGVVSISDPNSQWTITNTGGGTDLTVGAFGSGSFTLANQASFTAGAVTLGLETGSKGIITINGAAGGGNQTLFTTTGILSIGDSGQGIFNANGGAQVVSTGNVFIGNDPGPSDMATITDPKTVWTISGSYMFIGNGGIGFLTVQNGATVNMNQGSVLLGESAAGSNSQGTLTVTGSNSTFTAGSLNFGDSGSTGLAALSVTQGGKVNITGTLSILGVNASNTIFVDGKSSTGTPSQLTVGTFTEPSPVNYLSITVSNQAKLIIQNAGTLAIDGNSAGAATLTIASGGQMNAGQTTFNLGLIDSGTLNVTGGGSFTSGTASIGGGSAASTATIGGSGGASSTWNISGGGNLVVSENGTLAINQGGTVTVAGTLSSDASPTASITVNGAGAVLTMNGQGNDSLNGTLSIMGGGVVNASYGDVTIGGQGATITGSGSSLSAYTLTVGTGVSGNLTVSSSGRVNVAYMVTVSNNSTLDLTGGGGMNIGPFASAADGSIVIAPGGVLLDNGTVLVRASSNGKPNVTILPFGTLSGGGTVNATLVSNLGRVGPSDPQTLTINGNYLQGSTGTLELEVAGTGAGQYDRLVVTGQATLGGYLELDFSNGFAPQAGQVFNLLSFGATAGQFAGVEVTGLAPGWTFTLNSTGTALNLDSTSNGVPSPEFVVPPGPNVLLQGVPANENIHFTGGVLEAATSTALSNPVILDLAGGIFQADAGTVSMLSGVISGPGSFTKTGPGLLALTGNNSYQGGTAINGGVLAIFSDANLGAAGISLSFDGGTLQTLANFTTSRGITLNAGGGTIDTNGFDATLNSIISGVGGLTKIGAGSLSLEAQDTYTGPTIVEDGKLYIDGSVVGDVDVFSPGLLGGHGFIGGSLFNAGIVSPGNSPGTLTVRGNYVQSSAGALVIEIAGTSPGSYDLLKVGGHATLGGTLQFVRLNNFQLQRGDVITFLTAAGGVSGLFSTVQNPFTNTSDTILQAGVIYGPNSVSLEELQGSFRTFAKNARLAANEVSVGGALDSVVSNPRANALINYLDGRSLSSLAGDLVKIDPEQLTSMFTVGIALANVQSLNLQRRTDDIRSGASGFSAAGFAMNGASPGYSGGFDITTGVAGPAGPDGKEGLESKQVSPQPVDQRWGAFLSGTGQWVNVGDTDNARGYNIDSGGFTLGVDYKVCEHFAVGLSFGYTGTTVDLTAPGRIFVNGGKVGIYATTFFDGWYADAAVNGGYNSYDTHRVALQGQASGSPDGGELNGVFGTGYDFKKGALTFGPTATFNYTYVSVDDFTEHGSLAPLNIHGSDEESLRTALGFKVRYDWKVGGVLIKPELRAAWQHEFGDTTYALDSNFADGAGSAFTVNGPKIGRDSALVSGGFAVQLSERCSTYLYYDGELGRANYHSSSVSGGFRVDF